MEFEAHPLLACLGSGRSRSVRYDLSLTLGLRFGLGCGGPRSVRWLGQLGNPATASVGHDSPGKPVSPARPITGAIVQATKKPIPEVLQKNYLIRLALAQGEEITEFTLLTASPSIFFNGTGGGGEIPVVVTFSGSLTEAEGGKVILVYSDGGRIPLISEAPALSVQPNGRPLARNVEYRDETSTGAIHLTPGKSQTLIKSGGRSYSVTITPADEPPE